MQTYNEAKKKSKRVVLTTKERDVIVGIFIKERVDRLTVPSDLYFYEIRTGGYPQSKSLTIESVVRVDFGGTLILDKELIFPLRVKNLADNYLSLSGKDMDAELQVTK